MSALLDELHELREAPFRHKKQINPKIVRKHMLAEFVACTT
jgi:hypothetical protein